MGGDRLDCGEDRLRGWVRQTAVPVTATVPDPGAEADPVRAGQMRGMLDYMGLAPGMALEELRAAAAVLRGRRAVVPGLVVPGSVPVRRQAEAEGLDRVFIDAGLECWGEPGCSMCVGINGDLVPAGERCASTTNRNFPGRLTDVRKLDVRKLGAS